MFLVATPPCRRVYHAPPCCRPLLCQVGHLLGPPRSRLSVQLTGTTKQRSITHYLKQGPLPCRRGLEVKYSWSLICRAALPSRAGSVFPSSGSIAALNLDHQREPESVGIAPPLLAGTPTAGRELQPEQPLASVLRASPFKHMFRTAAPPVSVRIWRLLCQDITGCAEVNQL